MSSAALAHDALLPRPPGGTGAGAALAVVVHVGLIVALTTSIDWRSHPQEVVAAELWASVPQIAAPEPAPPPRPAPTPAPPPPAPRAEAPAREADIAIEQDKKRKAEEARKKAEADAERERLEAANKKKERDKAEADKKKREQDARDAAADEQRLAEQREANLRRMMGQAAQATTGTGRSPGGTAAQDAAPSAAYAGRVAALIRRNSVFTGSVPGNPAAEVEVTTGASGTIISRTLVKPSGHKPWDDAVLQAIDKVGTLPRDADGRVPTKMIIAFRPKE